MLPRLCIQDLPKTLLQKFKDDIMHGKENLIIEYNEKKITKEKMNDMECLNSFRISIEFNKKTNIILTLISTSKNKFTEE